MRSLLALALAATLVLPVSVRADKPDKPDKPDHAKKHHEKEEREATVRVVFTADQRERTRLFFVETYGRGRCPPGLAKKGTGCLPPGQAKRRYVVGRPLPAKLVLQPVPVELSVRIGVAPAGYRYGIIDGDLVKLTVGTMLVVDAIEGLVD